MWTGRVVNDSVNAWAGVQSDYVSGRLRRRQVWLAAVLRILYAPPDATRVVEGARRDFLATRGGCFAASREEEA